MREKILTVQGYSKHHHTAGLAHNNYVGRGHVTFKFKCFRT